jgi:hypothetical protein
MIILANKTLSLTNTCHRGLILRINKIKGSQKSRFEATLITYIKRTDCILNASDPPAQKQIHPKNQNRKNTSKNSRNYHNKDPRRKGPRNGFPEIFPNLETPIKTQKYIPV